MQNEPPPHPKRLPGLPPEILHEVFKFAVDAEVDFLMQEEHYRQPYFPLHLSQVCKQWRGVTHSSKVLWRDLPCIDAVRDIERQRWYYWMGLACGGPLFVRLCDNDVKTSSTWGPHRDHSQLLNLECPTCHKSFIEHSETFRMLVYVNECFKGEPFALNRIGNEMPLHNVVSLGIRVLRPIRFECDRKQFGAVQSLFLHGVSAGSDVTFGVCPRLTSLVLNDMTFPCRRDLKVAVEACCLLRRLVLSDITFEVEKDDSMINFIAEGEGRLSKHLDRLKEVLVDSEEIARHVFDGNNTPKLVRASLIEKEGQDMSGLISFMFQQAPNIEELSISCSLLGDIVHLFKELCTAQADTVCAPKLHTIHVTLSPSTEWNVVTVGALKKTLVDLIDGRLRVTESLPTVRQNVQCIVLPDMLRDALGESLLDELKSCVTIKTLHSGSDPIFGDWQTL